MFQPAKSGKAFACQASNLTVNRFQLRKARQAPDVFIRDVGVIFEVKFDPLHTSQRLIKVPHLKPDRRNIPIIVEVDSTRHLLEFGNQTALMTDIFETPVSQCKTDQQG